MNIHVATINKFLQLGQAMESVADAATNWTAAMNGCESVPGTLGLLTVADYHEYRRSGLEPVVYCNGVDVTLSCVAADDRAGWATCYVRVGGGYVRAAGTPPQPVVELLTGRVTFFKKR